jgi:cell division septation protein DedD
MEDSTSWKGHSFTLVVFTGIVMLCAIFFTLGMLVGRSQGQKLATAAAAEAAAKLDARFAPDEEKPEEFTFYESVEREKQQPALEAPAPAMPDPVRPADEPPARVEPPSTRANVVNYQIAALKKSVEAKKLLQNIKSKGFRAFILAPPPGDASPLFRVQVGPFSNTAEAESARTKLEAAGFRPILKK